MKIVTILNFVLYSALILSVLYLLYPLVALYVDMTKNPITINVIPLGFDNNATILTEVCITYTGSQTLSNFTVKIGSETLQFGDLKNSTPKCINTHLNTSDIDTKNIEASFTLNNLYKIKTTIRG